MTTPTLPQSPPVGARTPAAQHPAALPATPAPQPRSRVSRRWAWLLIPTLAVVAYAPVLRIGFLSDDFLLLFGAKLSGIDLSAFRPNPAWPLYRPLSTVLTWQIGAQLWGYNPLPFHLLGLLLHAATALVLAACVAEISARPGLGWLTGALFAVFPLHLEAVGWLAAQWDLWAACFGLLSLWLFVAWWRRGRRWPYLAGLLCYAFGLLSKESLMTFLPLFAIAAWATNLPVRRRDWQRLVVALLPFGALLALYVGLRFATWHSLGGYAGPFDYAGAGWDQLLADVRLLLAPINSTVLGPAAAQFVGLIASLGLFLGLVWYGRSWRRLLVLAGSWIVLTILPVLNMGASPGDLQQNRFFYLAAAGYCTVVAVLLYAVLTSARRRRPLVIACVGVLLAAGIGVSAVQLQPWAVATLQASDVGQELDRLIPPEHRRYIMHWVVADPPDTYKGAYVLRLGLPGLRYFVDKDPPWVDVVPTVAVANIASDFADAFILRFRYDAAATRFHVDYAAGVTGAHAPPTPAEAGTNLRTWDFRDCAPAAVGTWRGAGAHLSCQPGEGILVDPTANDPQLLGPALRLNPAAVGARFIRIRIAARYQADARAGGQVNTWFWEGANAGWSEDRSRSLPLKADGQQHVYWTVLSQADAGRGIAGLRFDPANATTRARIQWIAVDLVQ